MMNRMMKMLLVFAAAVSVMAVTVGVWVMKTESGKNAASRLTTISVELLMSVIHVMVDACRFFAA